MVKRIIPRHISDVERTIVVVDSLFVKRTVSPMEEETLNSEDVISTFVIAGAPKVADVCHIE